VPPLPIDTSITIEQQVALPLPAVQQQALRRDWNELPTRFESALPAAEIQPAAALASSPTTPPETAGKSQAMAAKTSSEEEFKILGVLGKLYVLMEGKEGLVMMDQHAAHERVLFEKMRYSMEREGVPSQRLLMPLMLHVSPRDYELLSRNLDSLVKLGIEAEPFGANTLKVDALPAFLHSDDPAALLSQIVDELASLSSKSSSLRLGEDMIATTACRHAVKANDHLRGVELASLVRDLMACEMPYCCPHGRPTLIQISYPELERKFGRRAP
jgi:DNA mismatch repair protein MutL